MCVCVRKRRVAKDLPFNLYGPLDSWGSSGRLQRKCSTLACLPPSSLLSKPSLLPIYTLAASSKRCWSSPLIVFSVGRGVRLETCVVHGTVCGANHKASSNKSMRALGIITSDCVVNLCHACIRRGMCAHDNDCESNAKRADGTFTHDVACRLSINEGQTNKEMTRRATLGTPRHSILSDICVSIFLCKSTNTTAHVPLFPCVELHCTSSLHVVSIAHICCQAT